MAFDHRYTQVMLEQVYAQNEMLLDILAPTVKDVQWLKAERDRIHQQTELTYAVVRAQERDLKDHKRRITALEAAS